MSYFIVLIMTLIFFNHRKSERIMDQIDDLTAAIATLTADSAKTLGDLSAKITDLIAAVAAAQAANPAVDLTAVIASVNDLDATVKAADQV